MMSMFCLAFLIWQLQSTSQEKIMIYVHALLAQNFSYEEESSVDNIFKSATMQ